MRASGAVVTQPRVERLGHPQRQTIPDASAVFQNLPEKHARLPLWRRKLCGGVKLSKVWGWKDYASLEISGKLEGNGAGETWGPVRRRMKAATDVQEECRGRHCWNRGDKHVHRAPQDHAVKVRAEIFSQEPGTLKPILCLLVRPWEISAPQVVIEMDQKTETECVVEIKKEKRWRQQKW